jgi:hypothetical protein
MLTDTEVADVARTMLAGELADLAPRDSLLADVRSRYQQTRTTRRTATGAAAAVTAAVAAALVLASGPGAVRGQHGTAGHTRTVVTAAWTVREAADGTVTIYLRQYANPDGMQRTLRADGINAIVRPTPIVWRTFGPRSGLLPATWRKLSPPFRLPFPACVYRATNRAPLAVQRAVVTFVGRGLPALFVIHPHAMPPGSALFLTFWAGLPSNAKNDNTGVFALKPVVLNSDTVPACVHVTKYGPVPPK